MSDEEELPPFKIEPARSSRSKCKTCRKKIDKEVLRLGVLVDGNYGPGYMWHHLNCAARDRIDDVEEAYAQKAWAEGLEVPDLEGLKKRAEKAQKRKKEKKLAPYAEQAPTGRSKCKHCDGPIEKGAWRVALLRTVEFGGQVRAGPINVHPECVAAEVLAEDCATEPEEFEDKLRENSRGVSEDQIDEVLGLVGPLEPGA